LIAFDLIKGIRGRSIAVGGSGYVRYRYRDSLQVYSGIGGGGRSIGSSLTDKTALILIVTTLKF